MPALSPTMTQGNIVSWRKKEGDTVQTGESIADIETDKATLEFEAIEDGVVAKILIGAGAQGVLVNTPIAIMVEEKDHVDAFKNYKEGKSESPAEAKSEPVAVKVTETVPSETSSSQPVQSSAGHGKVLATPAARHLAENEGIDLGKIQGTGFQDRIVVADLKDAKNAVPSSASASTAAPTGGYVDIPLSNMRKVIAERLLFSKQNIPHYYITAHISADRLMELRQELNKTLEAQGVKLSFNDFVIKASAAALRKVPTVNSSWMDTSIRQYDYVDISVGVATDAGLITPIINGADKKGLAAISSQMKDLAARAKDKKTETE